MAHSDASQRHQPFPEESSRPSSGLEHPLSRSEDTPSKNTTPLLALIGRLTILGFALAWGLALLQAIQ